MSFFAPKVIEDHATAPIKGLQEISSFIFSANREDSKRKSYKMATRFSSVLKKGEDVRLKGKGKKEFWKIAPDGKTILRLYDGEEPLDFK
jgi:hypothetical protein